MLEHDLLVCVLTFCDIDIILKICYKRFPILYYSGEILKDAEAIRARCWTDTRRYMRKIKMLQTKSNSTTRNISVYFVIILREISTKHRNQNQNHNQNNYNNHD